MSVDYFLKIYISFDCLTKIINRKKRISALMILDENCKLILIILYLKLLFVESLAIFSNLK